MNYERPPLLEQLAAAYVLGTMSARARRRFGHVLADSLAAQRAVAAWHEHLHPLNRSIVPLAPPARVWRAIERRTRPASGLPHWLRKLDALLAGWAKPALAFAFGIVLTAGLIHQTPQTVGLEPIPDKLAASYVGLLTDASGAPVLAASSLRQGRILSVKLLKPLAIPGGQVAVLWALPKDAAPIPVSTIPANGKADIPLNAAAETIFAKVSRLAVTFETSATPRAPSGEFVLSGHCVKIW